VISDSIRHGVFYMELKASPDGYVNVDPPIDFDYSSVVNCLLSAFSEAQRESLEEYQGGCLALGRSQPLEESGWPGDILGRRYSKEELRQLFHGSAGSCSGDGHRQRFPKLPCKVSLVFVGKRHKSFREMVLEAAGAAVMRPAGEKPTDTARDFVEQEFKSCRVVGFDLAGPEVGFPPSLYANEFGRLSRLHVPITVHAGENAPAEFIENAILELGAVRIGHGLSLIEDPRLMARVRDERIAIELCPVCNHQTSQFHSPHPDEEDCEEPTKELKERRLYPLKAFLKSGIYVSINTDNPIISYTNMVKEYFQASYAFSADGLTLWEALRIIRMGYVCSFLNLQERGHMLEIVGQHLFDLFSDQAVVNVLRRLRQSQSKSALEDESGPVVGAAAEA
jgi:adenosine deaminase